MRKNSNNAKDITLGKSRRMFILIAAVITAIAVAVACTLYFGSASPVSVDEVSAGEVDASTTYTNKAGDLTPVNAIAKGDILNYTTVGQTNLRLPTGTYTIEVWGAQGGTTSHSSSNNNTGGYSKATLTLKSPMWIHIGVGGKGANGTGGNAYNGGGSGGKASSDTSGGGGATHIAANTSSSGRGELRYYSSYRSEVLLVAGGGGGNGCSNDVGGKGGGASGTAGTANSGYGTAGAPGTASGPGASRSGVSVAAAFGLGGSSSTSYYGCGGGGGGWYGGSAGNNVSGGGVSGGGGSGYVGAGNSSAGVTVSGGSMTVGGRTGNGMARITVVQVNQAPTSKNYTVSSSNHSGNFYRGTSRNINIYSYTLASDPDYGNTSGSNANSVYFTKGTTSNFNTLPGANAGLYLDSGCTKSASTYLNWSWNSNGQILSISNILKYPRSGVDGCTANGRLSLWVKIRDNYGTSTTRGVAVIPFYLTVNDNGITHDSTAFKTIASNVSGVSYRYGTPTHTGTANENYNFLGNPTSIYNPTSSTVKTIFIPKPLAPTDDTGYTIYASSIYSDRDTAYDNVAIKSVAATASSAYYTITYHTDSTYATGFYPAITIKPTGQRPTKPTYVCATITAQTSEKASRAGIGSTNTSVQLVFRIANTRPYFASSSGIDTGISTEPYIELTQGESKTIDINQIVRDVDDASLTAYFAQGASNLVVPANEYIQVDMSNVAVPLKTSHGGRSSNYAGKTEAAADSYTTGQGKTATGFAGKEGVIVPTGSSSASLASVTYSYDNNKTLRFTARAATTYLYGDSSKSRLGDFYVLVRIVDPSDIADTGLWYPIAIKVNSSAPKEPATIANVSIDFGSSYTAGTETSDALQSSVTDVFLTPISYTAADGTIAGIGTTNNSYNQETATHVQPFVVDPDTFMFPLSTGGPEKTRPLNDLVLLDGTTAESALILYDTSDFFEVSVVSLYASQTVFSRLGLSQDELRLLGVTPHETDGYAFYGLKITAKRSTGDEYFQFDVKVKDSHNVKSTVRIAVNVKNRSISPNRATTGGEDFSTKHNINYLPNAEEVTPRGEYVYNSNIRMTSVNYIIERNDVLQITPYDFAYDFDVDPNDVANNAELNTNPANPGFDSFANNVVLKSYNIPHTSSIASPATAPSPVIGQQLSFSNTDNLLSNAAQYGSYIKLTVEDKSIKGITAYDIPCIKITGLSRTTSTVVQLRFTVSDGYSSLQCVITVTVLNAKPVLNTVENHPKENDSDVRVFEPYTMTVNSAGTTIRNVYEFTARDIAYDKDGDTPTFVPGSVRIVAYDNVTKQYYSRLTADGKGIEDGDTTTAVGYDLSDYVYSTITKNSSGDDIIRIRALSSTQLFSRPIYLEFQVQDGFRAQPQTATLHVLIDVVNSQPQTVTDSLLDVDGRQTWMIKYESSAEKMLTRYIFNSKELHDNAPVSATPANKVWLFDDPDAMQRVMLNPQEWNLEGASSTEIAKRLVLQTDKTDPEEIRNMFLAENTAGYNAAVIYNPTYNKGTAYLTINVLFFEKGYDVDGNVVFTQVNSGFNTCEYWALEIKGPDNSNDPMATRIAIAIKDNHHGDKVRRYNAQKTATVDATSDFTWLDFYFEYQSPGIAAMHEYYRTDGKGEALTYANGVDDKSGYLVDVRSMQTYQFVNEVVPTTQQALSTAPFIDDFRYQYFVKNITKIGNDTVSIPTRKHYAAKGNQFYYRPVRVRTSTTNPTVVPMSYIAMPLTGLETGTESGIHVTFANATTGSSATGEYKLVDSGYRSWGGDNEKYVMENVTLSDASGNTWTTYNNGVTSGDINDNPYLKIEYTAVQSGEGYLESEYLNKNRFRVIKNSASENETIDPIALTDSNGDSIFREDKYGFKLSKKEGGVRANGNLKLTVSVKTTGSNAKIETASVDIILEDKAPTVKYNEKTLNGGISSSSTSDTNRLMVQMSTGDTVGKKVTLNDEKVGYDKYTGDYQIIYNDGDVTDTMKFYLPSATGALTQAELDHIGIETNAASTGAEAILYEYFKSTSKPESIEDAWKDDGGTPNPGYERFFTVSPGIGASSTLQFIPVAKTQLNFTDADDKDAILEKYHLEQDEDGGIYYPFRVLFYDDYNGSAFTSGYWMCAVIRVYIVNDAMAVNTSAVTGTYRSNNSAYNGKPMYEFRLAKGTPFLLDVSTLLIDNDILLDNASMTYVASAEQRSEVLDKIYTSADDKEFGGYVKDYIKMPASYERVNPSTGDLPMSIERPGEGSGMPETTLRFTASSAFTGTIVVMYTFADSAGSAPVSIIFSVSYNNEAPTPNNATFGGAETRNITLVSGQSFTLYAAEKNLFAGDLQGGFGQTDKIIASDYPDKTAAKMNEEFGRDSASKDLGSLIIGSDDAPSTLRIESYSLSNANDSRKLAFERLQVFPAAKNASIEQPMGLKVTALGVTDTVLTIKLVDAEEAATFIRFNINVLSTPPKVKSPDAAGFPTAFKPVAGLANTFETELSYGDPPLTVMLKRFIEDADRDDENGLAVYRNTDNTYFTVRDESGVSAVNVENGVVNTDNAIVITAKDFIPVEGGYSSITFRVADASGAVSDPITIRVKIKPQELTTVATATKPTTLTVKSYSDYIEDGIAVTMNVVADSEAAATMFADRDAPAANSSYDVAVYAMLKYSESEKKFTPIKADEIDDECLIIKRDRFGTQSGTTGEGKVTSYVRKFFDISITADGKTLSFIPRSATISSERNSTDLAVIHLVVRIGKRYSAGVGDSTGKTLGDSEGFLNVSVANSKVTAVENSPYNSGYPRETIPNADPELGETTRLRDSAFLEFTGTAGDQLTWDLYNESNPELGLFYDYDMRNTLVQNSDKTYRVDGEETLTYIRGEYRGVTETISSKTPLLTVSRSDDGKAVTVKINRKVFTGQPPKDGYENSYTTVYVDIYCADTLSRRAGSGYVVNTIVVNVENDVPEIKCIDDFAEGETRPDYKIEYSDIEGFTLNATVEYGNSLRLDINKIIKDSDIEMDDYVLLYTGGENSLMAADGYLNGSTTVDGTNDGEGKLRKTPASEQLFSVRLVNANNAYSISTLSSIVFTCVSHSRGETITTQLQFRDSVQTAITRVLTVNLTVDNSRPYAKPGVSTNVTVMGIGFPSTDEERADAVKSFSILDFIADDNGDAYNANLAENMERRPTYAFIDEIIVYTTDEGDASLRPSIYGPGKDGDGSEQSAPAVSVCMASWDESDIKHQTFTIQPAKGVYGVQKILFKITDSGFAEGSEASVLDGKTYDLLLTVTVANPLDDVDEILPEKRIAYGVTRTVTIKDLLGDQDSQGYVIDNIEETGSTSYVDIFKPGEPSGAVPSALTAAPSADNWRIHAKTEGSTVNLKVTFRAGELTRERTLPVRVVENTAPDYKQGKTSYEYTKSKLVGEKTLKVYPEDWFEDVDDEDIMRFVDPVVSSQSVLVETMYDYDDIQDGGRAYILLTFNYRGPADITLNVSDLSGRVYQRTITVNCTDAAEAGVWVTFVAMIEANWMWFWIILAAILLFIILLIILIVVIHKKRKMRREIEALLESETELEEEMMRLNAAATPYQSFGYLPPTQQTVGTGFMLGGGAQAPVPNSLQLNAGQTPQINSVPGSGPVNSTPGGAPVNSVPGSAPTNSVPGSGPVNSRPGNVGGQPASKDGFNPDEF